MLAERELNISQCPALKNCKPSLLCGGFLEAKAALEDQGIPALLPDFLMPSGRADAFLRVRLKEFKLPVVRFTLGWNPRLLRLNPHAVGQRDFLLKTLRKQAAAVGKASRP